MVGQTKQYVKFTPAEESVTNVDEEAIQQSLIESEINQFIDVEEIETVGVETGDELETVTVLFSIKRQEFEDAEYGDYNWLIDVVVEEIERVVGREASRKITEGW